jgi:hypothetical protein
VGEAKVTLEQNKSVSLFKTKQRLDNQVSNKVTRTFGSVRSTWTSWQPQDMAVMFTFLLSLGMWYSPGMPHFLRVEAKAWGKTNGEMNIVAIL